MAPVSLSERGRLTMNQYICRVCKGNECTVLTSQGPPDCGCLHNSDIGALWEQDSSYKSEREKVLDDIPDVLVCQSLPNEHGFCGKNDCFCKELQRVESGDICKWMQENRLRQSKAGEQ